MHQGFKKLLLPPRYFYISVEKEDLDSRELIGKVKQDGWIDSNTIIVNCSPDYSSRLVQLLNHKLSHLNQNELYEMLYLETPYPNMSQIWNPNSKEYELYDRYLHTWVKQNIHTSFKYLFIDSATLRGKNFAKLKLFIKDLIPRDQYRFASLYVQSDSVFKPDYFIEEFDFSKQGGLLFFWENADNPNWDY